MEDTKEYPVRSAKELVIELCKMILVEDDELDSVRARTFIRTLKGEEIVLLNSKETISKAEVVSIAQGEVMKYLTTYRNSEVQKTPFAFDSGGEFKKYWEDIEECYRACNNKALFPMPFRETFKYIKDISDHYRIFGVFFEVRSNETYGAIVNNLVQHSQQAAYSATKEAIDDELEKAVREFGCKIDEMKTEAVNTMDVTLKNFESKVDEMKKTAEFAVDNAVKDKMHTVTEKISETSVTILGIFAGIVLTVVAGLFYSSSVLDNVNNADIYKLVCVSAIIGLVTINLIAIMFDYINQIRRVDKKLKAENGRFHFGIILLDLILVGLVIGFGIASFLYGDESVDSVVNQQYDATISLDVNMQEQSMMQSEISSTPTEISITPTLTPEPITDPGTGNVEGVSTE